MPNLRALSTACTLTLALLAPAMAQNGPGLPNQRYAPGDQWKVLSRISAGAGQGYVTMHRGYLLVIFSFDSGGGNGSGGFALFDISNPRSPRQVFTTAGNSAYGRGTPNDARDIREAHGTSFSGDILCTPTNGGRGTGVQFWDFSNPLSPQKVGFLALPGLTGGDYSPTPWWISWQGGRYVYVAGTSAGLYIVDASNPAQPRLVDRGGPPNPIPVQQLSIPRCNVVYAMGNLLLTANASGRGMSLLDIGDPKNPVLLSSTNEDVGYSVTLNGDRVYAAAKPARVFDVSNPRSITVLGTGPRIADKGGYGMVQDGVFHYGSSDRYVALDTNQTPFRALGTVKPGGVIWPDWDFATPLGNLVFIGNDHPFGSVLAVHDANPDTTGPEVNMVSPPDGASQQPVTSRIGLTFSDQIDLSTVNASTLIVRRRGGAPIAGRTSHQMGILNFWPDQPLTANVAYEVVVPAGGIKDFAGNATSQTFTSTFTTGTALPQTLVCNTPPLAPAPARLPVTLQAGPVSGAPGPFEYRWDLGDGTSTGWSTSPVTTHTYTRPGHYRVTLEVSAQAGLSWTTNALTQTVHRPLPAGRPTGSSTVAYERTRDRLWVVNADNDTVSAIDGTSHQKLLEVPVGKHPRTIAVSPKDGLLWVACQGDASLRVLNPANGQEVARADLPLGSAPYGVSFTPAGDAAFVTLQASGLLAEIVPNTRQVRRTIPVGPTPRGVAVTADGRTALVTRQVSAALQGEVRRVDVAGGFVIDTIRLAMDPGPDAEDSGRGVPNYLGSPAISPDGARAWIPSKKDNTLRGRSRDGLSLTFENTVRAMTSQIDLAQGTEHLAERVDYNDREFPTAVVFSPLGDYAFVALQGSNAVEVRDAYDGSLVLAIETVGRAPQGLHLLGDQLFVHGFLSRTVAVFDVSALLAGTATTAPELARTSTVQNERLAADVLRGKQIFYDASDRRMNLDGYISCASCHLEGGSDGRVWDFTDRGEGLRNTIDLRGGRGAANGPLHWSANFDEVQDFEHDIRGAFLGRGFMDDADFQAASRSDPLGTPKAGVSSDLDALAAYVTSLSDHAVSPHRSASGALTPDAVLGKAVFQRLQCAQCHGGPTFSDSHLGLRHDAGTFGPASGGRLGGPLDGLDTPTLRGLFRSAPYLHDGSAATLSEVVQRSGPAHGDMASLPTQDKQRLIAYLKQIDGYEPAPALSGAPTLRIVVPSGSLPGPTVDVRYVTGGNLSGVSTVAMSLNGGLRFTDPTFDGQHRLTNVGNGAYVLTMVLVDGNGAAIPGTQTQASFFVGNGLYITEARSLVPGGNPNDPAAWSTTVGKGVLQRGAKVYTDRRFEFTNTAPLTGLRYLRTRNADKDVPGDRFLRFRVSRPVTVYVAFDARATWRPAWLHGWAPSGTLGTNDSPRNLFRKAFPAGTVTLGGNNAPGAGSMYSVIVEAQDAAVPINGLQASSGQAYQVSRFVSGEKVYTDRRYVFRDVGRLTGGPTLIRTANDDKRSRGNPFLTFAVAEPVTVLVLFDERANGRPGWLSGWQRMGWKVKTSDRKRVVYAKDFPAGQVALGGNRQGGAESMYSVVVVRQAQRPAP